MEQLSIENNGLWEAFLMEEVRKRVETSEDSSKYFSARLNHVDRLRIIKIENEIVYLGFEPMPPIEIPCYSKNVEAIENDLKSELEQAFAEIIGKEYHVEVLPVEIRK